MTSNVKAAVFASGTGSNFEAIMDAHETLGCEVVLLVCDQPEAQVLAKASERGIESFVFEAKNFATRGDYEQAILEQLQAYGIDWVYLAGYMRLIGETLLEVYEGKIVNIHPSLLPAFPGLDAIGQAFEAGVEKTGVTIHYIDAGVDTGPIIAQEELTIHPDETKETLQKRIQQIEHRLYPQIIRQLNEIHNDNKPSR